MSKQFRELREELLRAGIAPRHVRRYLSELGDHLVDLTAEEERAGRPRAEAELAARLRLGETGELAKAMVERNDLRSWSVRAPWAVFGIGPVLALGGAWLVALSLLWKGWEIFLPGADSPFGRRPGTHELFEVANVYFQLDRAIFFGAPILLGLALGLVAARQRLSILWPAVGAIFIALLASTAQVHATRIASDAGRHVSLSFTFAHYAGYGFGLFDTLVIFAFTMLPYMVWRWHAARFAV